MTESAMTAALIVTKSLIVLLGGTLTLLTVRAVRRTDSSALRSFAMGFGLITLGGVLSGGLFQVGVLPFRRAVLVESLLTAAGFAVLVKSLYVDTHLPVS